MVGWIENKNERHWALLGSSDIGIVFTTTQIKQSFSVVPTSSPADFTFVA
jgi:hypothetical protein